MQLQARVRIWGRPRGRSGVSEYLVSSPYIARENARVGAASMEFAAASCAFRLKEHKWAPLPVLDEIPEINYTPQPIVPERLTYIGVKLVDQDGEPVERSRVRVKLPDGDIREGRTDRDGELMIKGFVLDGIAEIELLDFVEALPEAATAEDEEVAAEEAAAAEDAIVGEKEFVVKVVDETGKGVSGVSLVFSGAGTSKTVPTDGSGVAKWKAAADSVEVTFESAEAVNQAMKAVWKSRVATAESDYVQPSSDIAAVVSRAKAIETPEGGMFASTSVDATQPMTLSIRPAKKRALLIELHDTLFRNNSAVVNPEGEAPSSTVGEHESITTVGLIATILRYNEEHEGKKLFVAGHTDRAGDEKDNVKLSEGRANAVLALIEGNKAEFVKACKAHYSEVDVTQLMDWTNTQYGFTCKPTTLTANPSDTNYYRFRTSYNEWVKGPLEDGEFGPRGTAINGEGRMQPPDIWDAMFDLYEHNLRQELGEDEGAVATLRSKLVWVDGTKKTIGFGEKHPTAENTVDGTRSQADRRVEVMLFDEEDLPNLAATNGEDVYDGVTFERKTIEPLLSAKPWRAYWDRQDEVLFMEDNRAMVLNAPGLPANSPVMFSIEARIDRKNPRPFEAVPKLSEDGGAKEEWSEWFKDNLATMGQDLNAMQEFPVVSFRFTASTGGRNVASRWLDYADEMDVDLTDDDDQPIAKLEYLLATPWGYRKGQSDDKGNVVERAIPPGGACLLGRKIAPVELDELPGLKRSRECYRGCSAEVSQG